MYEDADGTLSADLNAEENRFPSFHDFGKAYPGKYFAKLIIQAKITQRLGENKKLNLDLHHIRILSKADESNEENSENKATAKISLETRVI